MPSSRSTYRGLLYYKASAGTSTEEIAKRLSARYGDPFDVCEAVVTQFFDCLHGEDLCE
jgi:hypothetical protein